MIIRHKNLFILTIMILVAIALRQIPIARLPFVWFGTYFHEMSHGLSAILTGGHISRIDFSFNGAGLCYTAGGFRNMVTFSGYTGASIWGALIYLTTSQLPKWASFFVTFLLLCFTGFSFIFVRNIETALILVVIFITFLILWRFRAFLVSRLMLQFIGIFVLTESIYSPTYLFMYKNSGDHISLASRTLIPSFLWIIIWLIWAVFVLIVIYRLTLKFGHKLKRNAIGKV